MSPARLHQLATCVAAQKAHNDRFAGKALKEYPTSQLAK